MTKTAARHAGRLGIRQLGGLLKRSLAAKIVAGALVVAVAGGSIGGYVLYRAQVPTSFVIATDRGNGQIDRLDIGTRGATVLISNKKLANAPDSVVFMNDTQVLIDFVNTGDIGLGDIQSGAYSTISTGHGTLRDMAVRPDGSGVLIAEQSTGTLLEFHVADHSVRPFVQNQNLSGVQGLAFDPNGNLYAAVGGSVIQLDPTNGRQIKTFTLPGDSDGMAYDGHRNMLDIAAGGQILGLDPKTGKITTLIDGIGTADGVAIDRHGNVFIAADIGVLELTTDNQLLMVGTDTNGVTWDDVAPLSGGGAVSY